MQITTATDITTAFAAVEPGDVLQVQLTTGASYTVQAANNAHPARDGLSFPALIQGQGRMITLHTSHIAALAN